MLIVNTKVAVLYFKNISDVLKVEHTHTHNYRPAIETGLAILLDRDVLFDGVAGLGRVGQRGLGGRPTHRLGRVH